MSDMMPIIGPTAYSDEWWATRSGTIGASEAAAICGMSRDPYILNVGVGGPKGYKPRKTLGTPRTLEWF